MLPCPSGHLEAATLDGRDRRVVIPHGVRDYVVSADLACGLYRGTDERFYFFHNGTNTAITPVDFKCRATEMDFSPNGSRAAFYSAEQHLVRVCNMQSGGFRTFRTFGDSMDWNLLWSSSETILYLQSGRKCWEISLGPDIGYMRMEHPPHDFANHYGRVGTARYREEAFYANHKNGTLSLFVDRGMASSIFVSKGREGILRIKDPAGGLAAEQAVFIGGNEILAELGNYVYLVDVAAKRMGPVMRGEKFIALTAAFSKQVDF